jgi:hypothetical protein
VFVLSLLRTALAHRHHVTSSLWTYLLDNRKLFTNKSYEPTTSTLWVCANPRRVVLWETYYLRWDPALWPVAVSYKDATVAAKGVEVVVGEDASSSSSDEDYDEEHVVNEEEVEKVTQGRGRGSIYDTAEEATL